jgi:hypothetical protein
MLIFKLSILPSPFREWPNPIIVLVIISQGKMELLEFHREIATSPSTHGAECWAPRNDKKGLAVQKPSQASPMTWPPSL